MARRGIVSIARELKQNVERGQPYSLAFSPPNVFRPRGKKVLEKWLEDNYRFWSQTWLLPGLDEIIEKVKPLV
jgi:hypothetical protein